MNINSTRNALLRARNLRNAKRSRSRRVMSSRTNTTNRGSNTNSIKRPSYIGSSSQSKQISLYEKIEKAASDIQNTTKNMIVVGNMTYSDDEAGKAAKEKGWESLVSNIKKFVSDFNTVVNGLDDIAGATNLAQKKTLDNIVSANADQLKEIGITVSKSGELSIDEKTLTSADQEKVKALFAKENSFADKISSKMEAVESSAASSLTVLNKMYGATSTYNKYGTSNSYFGSNNYFNSGYFNNYGSYMNSGSWYI